MVARDAVCRLLRTDFSAQLTTADIFSFSVCPTVQSTLYLYCKSRKLENHEKVWRKKNEGVIVYNVQAREMDNTV